MRRFLGSLLMIALLIIVIGVYRGWFTATTDRDATGTDINLRVNREKIEEDKEKVRDKLQGVKEQAKEKVQDIKEKN